MNVYLYPEANYDLTMHTRLALVVSEHETQEMKVRDVGTT